MNNLFIFVGAAGVGKSAVIDYIRSKDKTNFYCIIKHTNRPMRKEEIHRRFDKELDLIFEEDIDPNINDPNIIKYKKGEYYYWIKHDEIITKLKKYKNCFMLTTGFAEAKQLKKEFLYDANCIICYIHTDSSVIINRMKNDNYTDQEIEFRVKRTIPIWSEYVNQNFNTVQHCILNNGSMEDLYLQVDKLITFYN